MTATRLSILLTVVLLAVAACLFEPPSYPVDGSLEQEFQLFFENHDRLYTGFSVRPEVDWNALHDQYRASLDTVTSHDGLMLHILHMLENLEDANIFMVNSMGLYHSYEPDLQENYDMELTYELLEPWGGVTWIDWEYSDSTFGYAFITDSIPYIIMTDTPFEDINDFDQTFELFRYSPAMIIDARALDSGVAYFMDQIVKRFTNISPIVYYLVERNGPGHDDFTDPEQVRRSHRGDWQFWDRPVILMAGECNRGYAVAFVQMMSEFPNVTVIGDTTSGIIGDIETFEHPENCLVAFPTTAYLDTDYQFIDRAGVPPDTYVEATEEDFQMGVDPVWDYALELLTGR
jgi:hypothetical protein